MLGNKLDNRLELESGLSGLFKKVDGKISLFLLRYFLHRQRLLNRLVRANREHKPSTCFSDLWGTVVQRACNLFEIALAQHLGELLQDLHTLDKQGGVLMRRATHSAQQLLLVEVKAAANMADALFRLGLEPDLQQVMQRVDCGLAQIRQRIIETLADSRE
jgi:hypothetical protein